MRAFNFSAGPATLPLEVLEEVRDEFLDYHGTGMSIMEMSHRWKFYEDIHFDAMKLLREIASIPDRFDILFMTGGASSQFALVPMNLSEKGRKAGYIHTGVWSKKAIAQANILGLDVHILASSESTNFDHVPGEISVESGLDYIHMTSNNTIYGTQFHTLPDASDSKLVIDMSSDFLYAPIQWDHIGIAYAGMQKNAGPSGATVVIIDRAYYEREREDIPTMLRYSTYGENDSMYNTPPTFQIYMFYLNLKWIKKMGGLTAMKDRNQRKAKLLYDTIDGSDGFYRGHSLVDSRSLMNVTFRAPTEEMEKQLVVGADEKKLWGLKGHRLVGGLRASIYNAMEFEGCEALVDFMKEFQQKNS